ncbi:MAG: ribulose-phosphate 3-epimerase [Clostridia bacterium]|nr:ribulose-phosphate 3-epimerase [Clostridia bacterium]
MVEISTSLLSVKNENALATIYELELAKTDYFHIDVMDGKFVEKDTRKEMLEYATIIKNVSNIPLDVHLMVKDIKENVLDYVGIEPNIITFHLEANNTKEDTMNLIKYIKESNIKVGISIKPNTDIEEVLEFLPYINLLLVMTVEPGKGGQKLIQETIGKIKQLKDYIEEKKLEVLIEVDGGVNTLNVNELKNAGVDIIVVGTAIINSKDYKKEINKLKTK